MVVGAKWHEVTLHFPHQGRATASATPRGGVPPRSCAVALTRRGCWSALALLIAIPSIARAAPSCTVTVAGDILFGTYDVFSPTPLDTNVRVRLNCPKGQTPIVMISKGNNSTTYWPRKLSSGASFLEYNLFLDAARQVVWGDGTEGTSYFTAPGGNAQTQIYARIPPGQDAVTGIYSDGVVVTIFL